MTSCKGFGKGIGGFLVAGGGAAKRQGKGNARGHQQGGGGKLRFTQLYSPALAGGLRASNGHYSIIWSDTPKKQPSLAARGCRGGLFM